MTTAYNVLQAIVYSIVLVRVCVLTGRFTEHSEPPAELVATIKGWPPPRDPWGPPDRKTMQRSCFWQPWMDLPDPTPFYPPPSWQRVGA